jgi:hypothetical protein
MSKITSGLTAEFGCEFIPETWHVMLVRQRLSSERYYGRLCHITIENQAVQVNEALFNKKEAMDESIKAFIIEGICEDGAAFRPSDWTERLAALMSTFGPDRRLSYSPLVQPCLIQGQRCLVIARDLEQKQPEIYSQIMKFAQDNQLRIQPDRRQRNEPVKVERRQQK